MPGEADAALHRLRSKLDAGAGPRGLPPAVTAALECAPACHAAWTFFALSVHLGVHVIARIALLLQPYVKVLVLHYLNVMRSSDCRIASCPRCQLLLRCSSMSRMQERAS